MALFVIVYLTGFFLTYPAIFADFDGEFPSKDNRVRYRHHLGFAVFAGLVPVFWLLTPFLTGFYVHGFKFK